MPSSSLARLQLFVVLWVRARRGPRHLPPPSNVGSGAATRDGLLNIAPSPPRAAPTRKASQGDWRTHRPQRLATYPVRTTFRHLPPSRATPHGATPSHASTRAASANCSPRRCPHLAAGVEPHALRLHVFATSPGEPPSTTFRHLPSSLAVPCLTMAACAWAPRPSPMTCSPGRHAPLAAGVSTSCPLPPPPPRPLLPPPPPPSRHRPPPLHQQLPPPPPPPPSRHRPSPPSRHRPPSRPRRRRGRPPD